MTQTVDDSKENGSARKAAALSSATAIAVAAEKPGGRLLFGMRPAMLVPLIVACALFMEHVDATVIATSLPLIARDLGVAPIVLKLGLTSYLVSLAVFIPDIGLADRPHRRAGRLLLGDRNVYGQLHAVRNGAIVWLFRGGALPARRGRSHDGSGGAHCDCAHGEPR